MRKVIAVSTALAMFAMGAEANEMVAQCEARMEADGRDPSGCQCLFDAVSGDAALQSEFESLGEIEDPAERYAAASAAARAAMDSCTR